MSLPPWYRSKTRPLAEAVRTLDLSRTTGIGPLVPGLSTMWDLTPLLCAPDPSHRVRVTVDAEGRTLSVTRHRKAISMVMYLVYNRKRLGSPLRALCDCGRYCYRLYLWGSYFRCGKCLHVTYVSGQRDQRDRAINRMQRLEYRLACTENMPRHRGRRKIQAEITRQDGKWFSTMPASLLRKILG
jgi:hypothetical protein